MKDSFVTREHSASPRIAGVLLVLFCLVGYPACGWLASSQQQSSVGLQSVSAGFQFRPTSVDNRIRYRDACGATQVIDLEPMMTAALTQEMKTVFAGVETSTYGGPAGVIDRLIQAELSGNDLIVFVAGKGVRLYPATLTLGTMVSSSDASGMLLDRVEIQSQVVGSVRTEEDRCEVFGVQELAQEVVGRLAKDFREHLVSSKTLQSGIPSSTVGSLPVTNPARGNADLERGARDSTVAGNRQEGQGTVVFRALLKDQNHNQVLEGGEAMIVEIEVTNSHSFVIQGVQVEVTGSSSLTRLMTNTINIGTIQPGETKRVKVRGRVGAVSTRSEGELLLMLRVGTPGVLQQPGKRFMVTVGPHSS